MNERLTEIIICYIEQFGFDLVIGKMKGLNLLTIIRLKEIVDEEN